MAKQINKALLLEEIARREIYTWGDYVKENRGTEAQIKTASAIADLLSSMLDEAGLSMPMLDEAGLFEEKTQKKGKK